jgi:hypothetical protein
MTTSSRDLNLNPNGVVFTIACAFLSQRKPAHIDKLIASGQVFAAVTKKQKDWYQYIYRARDETEYEFLRTMHQQGACVCVDASFLEIIDRLQHDADRYATIVRLINVIDSLHTRLAAIEDGEAIAGIRHDIAELQTLAVNLTPLQR